MQLALLWASRALPELGSYFHGELAAHTSRQVIRPSLRLRLLAYKLGMIIALLGKDQVLTLWLSAERASLRPREKSGPSQDTGRFVSRIWDGKTEGLTAQTPSPTRVLVLVTSLTPTDKALHFSSNEATFQSEI